MRLRMDDNDDDEDGDEFSNEEEEMIDEEEVDLVDDELHDALSARARLPTVTHAVVHQVKSADAQLSSALRAVQTSPKAVQLSGGGERFISTDPPECREVSEWNHSYQNIKRK